VLTRVRICGTSEYATDMSATVAARSIRSIGDIVARVPNALGNALDRVLALAELDMDHVTSECLVVVQGACAPRPRL
jgi:hypothetical protein